MGQLAVDLSNREELKRPLPVTQRTGIEFPRHFTAKLESGKTPYDEVAWELRNATIGN
jgi:ribonucleoside-diphosphate reductase alpha chain